MKTILVLTDFSKRSEHAAEFAWQLAIKVEADLLFYNSYFVAPSIQPVYVSAYPVSLNSYSACENQSMEALSLLTDKLMQKFQTTGDEYVPAYRCERGVGNLAENVNILLNREDIWMIAMGDKRNDNFLSEILLGSDVEEVVEVASCPVLMIPEKIDFHQIRKLALAIKKLENVDVRALNFLIKLAEPFNAQVVVAHVSSQNAMATEVNGLLEDFYNEGADIQYERVAFYNMHGDNVTKSLVKFEVAANLDMIGLINRKHGVYEELFHEGTTRKMMNYHNIPLLVFPTAYH